MKVWVVEAEHPVVPGRVVKVCGSAGAAEREAVSLAALIVTGRRVTAANWQRLMAAAQDAHGAAHCYVEIDEHEVIDAPEPEFTPREAAAARVYLDACGGIEP